MHRFSAEYLSATRRGMWESREALDPLSLEDRRLVVDVGCGTGALARVLDEETPGRVLGVDRDHGLLADAPVATCRGDARTLPLSAGRADLVACQALLVNLPDPVAALREFARVSSDLVATIEPDNGAVSVESSVPAEERLTARAREHYLAGVPTDATLGAVPGLFREAGLSDVRTSRYEHEQVVAPPYSQAALEAARRRATGDQLATQRDQLLAGGMAPAAYERLRADWREMGRAVVDRMRAGEYRRREVVPFHVTVGRV